MIDLARRSGQIASLSARVSSAKVTIQLRSLVWKRSWYTVRVRTKMHQLLVMPLPALKMAAQFEVMTRKQIELVRAQERKPVTTARGFSLGGNGKKTAIRRLFKIPACIH